MQTNAQQYTQWFSELGMNDVEHVGGKNASLGEMISNLANAGVSVPDGFATTASAYRAFLAHNDLNTRINQALDELDVNDTQALAKVGKKIRQWVLDAPLEPAFEEAVRDNFATMESQSGQAIAVAVRSSATAEDLPDASFAGQQETLLNVVGIENVLQAMKEVFASLYNDRAISYRVHQNFDHSQVALSAGIQRMVRSDVGSSGVMFTLDTESGFKDTVFITSSFGLGEMVVQGAVNPDEFYVHKPTLEAGRPAVVRRNIGSKMQQMVYSDGEERVKIEPVPQAKRNTFSLTDEDVTELAKQALIIEKHYQRPMDIEWGKDGNDGKIYILQARPETVKSRSNAHSIQRYSLATQTQKKTLCEGRAIGQKIGAGRTRVISSLSEMHLVEPGDVLVTDMTDPDWEPIMKRASAIVTNRGGRTCHAAIIARELGIPAVVGCGDATEHLSNDVPVTVTCAEGDTGFIFDGIMDFEVNSIELDRMPEIPFDIAMNVGNPDRAFDFAQLPNKGVGLARLEFIINRMIGVHPKALIHYDKQSDSLKETIDMQMAGYASPVDFYVDKIVEGVSTLAAAFYPKKVIVRMSDFKSNEYANLIGGDIYEPHEENPMIGYRGASRYLSEDFRECFELEARAMKYVRDVMGFTNVELMIPFVRTLEEAAGVIDLLADNGLKRGENGLRVIMMCELPSNAVLADEFLEYFDGFSIGSNDLTQLSLGLDRDSGLIAHLFDERNPAVKKFLEMAIQACNRAGKYIGICGQGPSDHPELARWLMDQGINSVSLNPDTVVETWTFLGGEKV